MLALNPAISVGTYTSAYKFFSSNVKNFRNNCPLHVDGKYIKYLKFKNLFLNIYWGSSVSETVDLIFHKFFLTNSSVIAGLTGGEQMHDKSDVQRVNIICFCRSLNCLTLI